MVSATPAPKDGQHDTPARSMAGTDKNIGREGITSQNVAWKWAAMRSASPVSRYSQITANKDTSGSDATRATKAGLRRAISNTAPMMIPNRAAFVSK